MSNSKEAHVRGHRLPAKQDPASDPGMPGKTPGTAEGPRDTDASRAPSPRPGKTPGQAEG